MKKVAEIVEETGNERPDRILVFQSLQRAAAERNRTGCRNRVSVQRRNIERGRYAKETNVDGLHPAVYHVKMADFLEEYKKSGLNVRVWTVNEETDMKELIEAGITAVITNYPDVAVRVRKESEN